MSQTTQTEADRRRSASRDDYAFREDEVDYGDGEDDRTPEEKAEDDALLEATRKNTEAFLRAPGVS